MIDEIENELGSLIGWFNWYDLQVNQYNRDIRINGISDIDIVELDRQAVVNSRRINELRKIKLNFLKNLK